MRLHRALLLAPLFLAACGGVLPHVRTAIEKTSVGVQVTDSVVAETYEAARLNAYEHETTLVGYRQAMRKWDDVIAMLNTAKEALRALERSVDAIEAGKDGDVELTIACTLSAVVALVDALMEVGLDPPHELTGALEIVGPLSRSVCDGGR